MWVSSYIGITVKESYSFKYPLIIYNVTNDSLKSTAINTRTDIVLEKNSNLKLITLFDDSSENNFINIVQNFDIEYSQKKWASYTNFSFSKFGDIIMGNNRNHAFESWALDYHFLNPEKYNNSWYKKFINK